MLESQYKLENNYSTKRSATTPPSIGPREDYVLPWLGGKLHTSDRPDQPFDDIDLRGRNILVSAVYSRSASLPGGICMIQLLRARLLGGISAFLGSCTTSQVGESR